MMSFQFRFLSMEGEESLLDSILGADNFEDMEDIDMVDVEEGELLDNNHQIEISQTTSANADTVSQHQQPQSKSNKKHKGRKRNRKKKNGSGPGVMDINRFVLDTCRRLKEPKSYLIWNAVGCLGVPALTDLVKEVDAIQTCGGQKTSDGRRFRTGGGILWNILKTRDPDVYKEIMKKGREFEKQFKAPNQNKRGRSEMEVVKEEVGPEGQNGKLDIDERQVKKRPVHERIRVPVSYDDLLEVEDSKEKTAV